MNATQYKMGIKDAGTIVVINKGAEVAILEIASAGLVYDLFKLTPKLKPAIDQNAPNANKKK